jgi:hypothetical protein
VREEGHVGGREDHAGGREEHVGGREEHVGGREDHAGGRKNHGSEGLIPADDYTVDNPYHGKDDGIRMGTTMSEYRDWNITLPFSVPAGDTDGVMTEALFNAALEHAPSDAAGLTARGDAAIGKVWIVFTLVNSSRGFADEVAAAMRKRVGDAVFSGDDACVSAV